jgi:alcohol dehydrogenase (cytochrome c)
MNYEALDVQYIAGTPFTGASLALFPGAGGNMGEFVAFDPVAGRRIWTLKEPLPVFGGALATAGGVVFYGTLDRKLKAVDAVTGRLLFSVTLECGIASAPITYSGPDGRQRVAITTGLGYLNGGFAGGACPSGSTFGGDGGGDAVGSLPQARAARAFAASHAPAAASTVTSGYVHVFKLP